MPPVKILYFNFNKSLYLFCRRCFFDAYDKMKCLLVIDMQEDYVRNKRNKKRYPYDEKKLILNINKKISEYPAEMVFYITNKFWW